VDKPAPASNSKPQKQTQQPPKDGKADKNAESKKGLVDE